jgi:hypothetical protein
LFLVRLKEIVVSFFSFHGLAWGIICLVTIGCGGPKQDLPEVVPVSGTVTLDGKPLANATVTFIPVGTTRGGTCLGVTDDSGRYEMSAGNGRKGTPVGEFRITCTKWVMPDGSDYPKDSQVSPLETNARELLPERYTNEYATELKATVPAAGTTVDLHLKSRR